jgi:hypothetical protein
MIKDVTRALLELEYFKLVLRSSRSSLAPLRRGNDRMAVCKPRPAHNPSSSHLSCIRNENPCVAVCRALICICLSPNIASSLRMMQRLCHLCFFTTSNPHSHLKKTIDLSSSIYISHSPKCNPSAPVYSLLHSVPHVVSMFHLQHASSSGGLHPLPAKPQPPEYLTLS